MLLTTQGVFRFDQQTKEMYLAQIHPGVRLEDVRRQIPWELKISSQLSVTPRPTDAEIDFVRRFAPAESLGREAATELAIAHAMERAQARGKRE
jgi:glutaconate CoA-transferase subunit B